VPQPHDRPDLATAQWQVSTFSGDQGTCVAVARLDADTIAVRNSNDPDAGVVYFTRREIDAFLKGAHAGEFDHFAQ
jgi:hypothetical protein